MLHAWTLPRKQQKQHTNTSPFRSGSPGWKPPHKNHQIVDLQIRHQAQEGPGPNTPKTRSFPPPLLPFPLSPSSPLSSKKNRPKDLSEWFQECRHFSARVRLLRARPLVAHRCPHSRPGDHVAARGGLVRRVASGDEEGRDLTVWDGFLTCLKAPLVRSNTSTASRFALFSGAGAHQRASRPTIRGCALLLLLWLLHVVAVVVGVAVAVAVVVVGPILGGITDSDPSAHPHLGRGLLELVPRRHLAPEEVGRLRVAGAELSVVDQQAIVPKDLLEAKVRVFLSVGVGWRRRRAWRVGQRFRKPVDRERRRRIKHHKATSLRATKNKTQLRTRRFVCSNLCALVLYFSL